MEAKIIDGKAIADSIKQETKAAVAAIKEKGVNPKLVVIIVGEDPASQIYVRNKERGCAEAGIESEVHRLSADTKEDSVIELIQKLNRDKNTHGILLQLPMPKGFDEKKILKYIAPSKDVDGLHTENLGMLLKGEAPYFASCTPSGCIELILSTGTKIEGKEAVVIGRSNIVGKPMAIMLMNRNATVTICHSKTVNLQDVVRRADIVVAAIGRAKMVKGSMIKPGAIVIDVGMNRTEQGLVGDVDFEEARQVASYITPVPRGVGPMTIAMLLKNTAIAAERVLSHH